MCKRARRPVSAPAKLRDVTKALPETDEDSLARLIEPHRRELHAHCYRMLGSVHDADDALQEALLGAWKGLPRFEGRSSLRSWLYTIATNPPCEFSSAAAGASCRVARATVTTRARPSPRRWPSRSGSSLIPRASPLRGS